MASKKKRRIGELGWERGLSGTSTTISTQLPTNLFVSGVGTSQRRGKKPIKEGSVAYLLGRGCSVSKQKTLFLTIA